MPSGEHVDRRTQILMLYKELGAATPEVIAKRLGLRTTQVRPGITQLTDAGLLRKTDRTGPSELGRKSYVWEIAPPPSEQPQGDLFG